MTSTQHSPPTTIKKLNSDNQKKAIFDEVSTIGLSVNYTAQGIFIMLGLIGYITLSTYSQRYWSISNQKPISLSQ